MLDIVFVKHVVDPGQQLHGGRHAVAGIQRQRAKTGCGVQIAPHHIALVAAVAVLGGHQSPQGACGPRTLCIVQAQLQLRRWGLGQGAVIGGVVLPAGSQRGLRRPRGCEAVVPAQLHPGGARIHIAHVLVAACVVEQDVVLHVAHVGRGPGLRLLALPLRAKVQLGGFFRLEPLEGVALIQAAVAGREQLPVIGKALHVAQPGIHRGALCQRLLPAHKATGHHVIAAAVRHIAAVAPHLRLIQPQPAHPARAGAGLPGGLGKPAPVAELGIAHPWLQQIRHAGCTRALVMRADVAVHPGHHLQRLQRLQRQRQAATIGNAAHIAGFATSHHAAGRRGTQGVVVHQVVRAVVVQLRLNLAQPRRQVALFHAQTHAVAAEHAAIHGAGGVLGPAIASAHSQLGQGVGIGRPAQCYVGIPLFVGRMHALACAVFVVVAVRAVGADAGVHLRVAHFQFGTLVVAAMAARHHAGRTTGSGLLKLGRQAVKPHHPGRSTWAPQHRLRPFDQRQAVKGFGRNVRTGRIHAPPAGPQHMGTVGQQRQARAKLASKHRIAVAAAAAQR